MRPVACDRIPSKCKALYPAALVYMNLVMHVNDRLGMSIVNYRLIE